MGNKYGKTTLDQARDELMSHVMRCSVLQARMEDRMEWLEDTLAYMGERYPSLNEMELAKLGMIGRQFVQPAIPHGSGNTAHNRPEPTVVTTTGEELTESEAMAGPIEVVRGGVAARLSRAWVGTRRGWRHGSPPPSRVRAPRSGPAR